jgi:hypothetical protein
MSQDARPSDHAMGLELQIEELVERRQRALVQGRSADAERLGVEIAALQEDLAATADRLAEEGEDERPGPELHDAEHLASGHRGHGGRAPTRPA